jgi:hypothetical protein
LKDVQDLDGILKTHRINGPPRITVARSDNFEHASTPKTFEGLGGRIGFALLGCKERVSDVDPHWSWETAQIPERRPNPPDGLQLALHLYTSIHIYIYDFQGRMAERQCASKFQLFHQVQ